MGFMLRGRKPFTANFAVNKSGILRMERPARLGA